MAKNTLVTELRAVLNKYSQENNSNTPDYILASYLLACLAAFDEAVQKRETWYGRDSLAAYASRVKKRKTWWRKDREAIPRMARSRGPEPRRMLLPPLQSRSVNR